MSHRWYAASLLMPSLTPEHAIAIATYTSIVIYPSDPRKRRLQNRGEKATALLGATNKQGTNGVLPFIVGISIASVM